MDKHGPIHVAAVTIGWCLCSVLGYYAGRSKGRPARLYADPHVRLRDAKSLPDRGMIGAAEYEMKRQQILREI